MSYCIKLLLGCCFLLKAIIGYSQNSQSDFSFPAPDSLEKLKKINLWATQYYIPQFKYSGKIPIRDKKGKNTGLMLDTCDFCDAALEGTAYITDSTRKTVVINFEKTGDSSIVDCRKCAKYAKSKLGVEKWGKALWSKSTGYGKGIMNYNLIPFRSIAADSSIIPYGSVIYIPAIKGLTIEMPDKTKVKHDGYFFAGDAGSAIKQNHIDVFTGTCIANPFPKVVTSDRNDTFNAYLVTDVTIIESLRRQHGK